MSSESVINYFGPFLIFSEMIKVSPLFLVKNLDVIT